MVELSAFKLTGKTALVTGGNTGIGLGIAKGLARAGAAVAIAGRDAAKSRRALRELEAIHELKTNHLAYQAFSFDLEQTEGIPAFYTHVSESMGGIDVLVNNAGIQHRGRADEIELSDLDRVLRVNLVAPYVLSQCFAREHIDNGTPGSILMTASLMSEAARPTVSPYTASKGGIRQLVRALAVDWAEFGIRVNGIGPGYIHTEMNQPLIDDPEFSAWVIKRTPLGRWGRPEDFEGIAVFLASDASRFVTGQIVYVDGGWLATF
jgi:gluconate 5-dehydrogenase